VLTGCSSAGKGAEEKRPALAEDLHGEGKRIIGKVEYHKEIVQFS
jgi:hypothetical protein